MSAVWELEGSRDGARNSSLTILIKELNNKAAASAGTAGGGCCTAWRCDTVGGSGEGEQASHRG